MFEITNLTNNQIVTLYREWSGLRYCAGFVSPSEEAVRSFRKWLRRDYLLEVKSNKELFDYELQMLEEFRRQENASKDPAVADIEAKDSEFLHGESA